MRESRRLEGQNEKLQVGDGGLCSILNESPHLSFWFLVGGCWGGRKKCGLVRGGASGAGLGPLGVLSPLPACGAAMRSQLWLQYRACLPDHAPCHGDDDELSGTGSPK